MIVIGLTGGIGAGKSTVAKLFEERGVPIIDADVLARELIQPHEPAFEEIIRHFSEKLLTNKGQIDRTQLRELIFKDVQERKWLENLLHPLIRARIEQILADLTAPYCIVIIPLLFETGSYPYLNRILVIDTSPQLQVERVITRDQSNIEKVSNILNSQVTREQRLEGADDIIHNNGSLADLIPQVEKLHHLYASLGKTP